MRRITAVRGEKVVVRRLSLDMAGRSLSDLAAFVPERSFVPTGKKAMLSGSGREAAPVRHLIEGTLRLVESAQAQAESGHYATVEAAGTTLTLSFATLSDIERAGLDGRAVASGTVDVRLFLAPGEAERYGGASSSKRRTVTAAYAPGDVPRLVLPVGSLVARGDTLALLHAHDLEEARADLDDALRVAAALDAQAPQDAIETARYRTAADEARAMLERLESLAREGYTPESAVASARAARQVADARLAAHEAQSNARQQAFSARRVEAEARVRRARTNLEKLHRTSAVTAPTAGTLARVDTLRTSTARHELRLHIE